MVEIRIMNIEKKSCLFTDFFYLFQMTLLSVHLLHISFYSDRWKLVKTTNTVILLLESLLSKSTIESFSQYQALYMQMRR